MVPLHLLCSAMTTVVTAARVPAVAIAAVKRPHHWLLVSVRTRRFVQQLRYPDNACNGDHPRPTATLFVKTKKTKEKKNKKKKIMVYMHLSREKKQREKRRCLASTRARGSVELAQKNFNLPSTTHRERAILHVFTHAQVCLPLPSWTFARVEREKKRKGLVRALSIYFVFPLASLHSCLSKIGREQERQQGLCAVCMFSCGLILLFFNADEKKNRVSK